MYESGSFVYTTSYDQFSAGILVKRNLYKRFGFATGYNFSRNYMEINLFSKNPVNSFWATNIYSHSIPLYVDYKYESVKLPGKYLIVRGGGGIDFINFEYMTFGMYNYETLFSAVFKYGLFYTIYQPVYPVPFAQVFVCFGDKIGKHGNIQVGVGYKYILSTYTGEMYYYFKNLNSTNDATEETFTLDKSVSEINFQITYAFDLCKKKMPDLVPK
jgi:hypothetical protein